MAGPGDAQQRLDTVVRIIASNMVAEVCSVYLMRAGEMLELFATEGLNPDAVHRTTLRVGEGLVGVIAAAARPLNLPNAQAHPQFAFRPETGEEIYHSLMGVPVLRDRRVVGVLVVQNRTMRHYSEEEVEVLQTVATVLAELVGAGNLVAREEIAQISGNATRPRQLEGQVLAEGLAQGIAVLHEPRIEVTRTIAEDTDEEKRRLEKGLEAMRAAIDRMLAGDQMAGGGEHREILETYRMFSHDRGWLARLREAVESGLTAEAAVQRVQVDTRIRMSEVADAYIRERLQDLEDLANRLLRHLAGKPITAASGALPPDAILVARSIGPAELLDYDSERLQGVILEEGSPTSHAAIVARALEIPVIGRIERATARIDPGDPVIVDGDHGQIFVRPGEDVRQAFAETMAIRAERQAKYAALRDVPTETRDGRRISLNLNAGLLADVHHLADSGADGIGLYRTELHFMVRATFPKVDAQRELYSRVLETAGGRRVVFRTLDIGGDKRLAYLGQNDEENPAMGWRAIRLALDRPGLLRSQVRALLQAAAGRDLDLMFPMVAEVAEFVAGRTVVEREMDRLRRLDRPLPNAVRVGSMVEVPSLAWQLPALLREVDFLSVGSNDLLQFLFAADRSNPQVANRYDLLSPAPLSFLRHLAHTCDAAKVPLSLCGEMAGRPLEAMALIGVGFRDLSMQPSAIGAVKDMILSLDAGSLEKYLNSIVDLPDRSLRGRLQTFAQDHGIVI